jgi:hypothetical protein
MFDQSESMADDIDRARTASIRFLNLVPSVADITPVAHVRTRGGYYAPRAR